MSLDFNLKGVQGESPQSKQSFDLKKEWSKNFLPISPISE